MRLRGIRVSWRAQCCVCLRYVGASPTAALSAACGYGDGNADEDAYGDEDGGDVDEHGGHGGDGGFVFRGANHDSAHDLYGDGAADLHCFPELGEQREGDWHE